MHYANVQRFENLKIGPKAHDQTLTYCKLEIENPLRVTQTGNSQEQDLVRWVRGTVGRL